MPGVELIGDPPQGLGAEAIVGVEDDQALIGI